MNSKYAYVYPLKNKDSKAIIDAFKKFINSEKNIKVLECDKGSEFISKAFKDFIKKNNINLLLFDKNISPNATSIVERFNGTIRGKIDNYLATYDTKKYIDVLDKLVSNYNNSKSQATKYKPSEVDEKIEEKLYIEKGIKKQKILK